jgi:hypothetical protein
MGRTGCTEPKCLYNDAVYFYLTTGLRLDVRLVALSYNVSLCSQNRSDGVITGRFPFYYYVSTPVCKYQRRILQCILG